MGVLCYLGIGLIIFYIFEKNFVEWNRNLAYLFIMPLFWPLVLLTFILLGIITMIDKWSKGGKYR